MKKITKQIVSLMLILVTLFCAFPFKETALAKGEEIILPAYNYDRISQSNKIIQDKNMKKYLTANNFLYWNYYVSTDTSYGKAYGHLVSDAIFNGGWKNYFLGSTISLDTAKEVLHAYIKEYLADVSSEYEDIALVNNMISLASISNDAYDNLRAFLSDMDQKQLDDFLHSIKQNKDRLLLCTSRKGLDNTTLKWAQKELDKLDLSSDQFNRYAWISRFDSISSKVDIGLKTVDLISTMYNWKADTLNRLNDVFMFKCASEDIDVFLQLIATHCIDPIIRKAASHVKEYIKTIKNSDILTCINLVLFQTTYKVSFDKLEDVISDKGTLGLFKYGFAGLGAAVTGIKGGVAVSNLLMNTGSTEEQSNKIRVISMISSALESKVADECLEYVTFVSELKPKTPNEIVNKANSMIMYYKMLILARELGEKQLFNMKENEAKSALGSLVQLFNNNFEDFTSWYANREEDFATMRKEVQSILMPYEENSLNNIKSNNKVGVDSNTRQAIYSYLYQIGDIPDFTSGKDIDPIWIVSKFFYQGGETPLDESIQSLINQSIFDKCALPYRKTRLNISKLTEIQQTARELFNPEVVVPLNIDYSYFDGSVETLPLWIPQLESVAWLPTDLLLYHEPYILDAYYEDGLYYVTGDLLMLDPRNLSYPGPIPYYPDKIKAFSGDREVGTVWLDDKGQTNYQFTVNPDYLSKRLFVLKKYGDNFNLLSKTKIESFD